MRPDQSDGHPEPVPRTPTPGTSTAGTPSPGTGTAGTPSPGTPSPGTPSPGTPSPGTPSPGTGTAGAPSPGTPSPGTSTPEPAPGTFTPEPVPGTPTPGTPSPPPPAGNRDRILTIPNGLSVLRLLGVPLFLWLVLGPHLDAWAVVLLIASAATDWLDGKIARAFNQQSRLGEALDPAADRLYIAATLVALAVRNIIPWWLVALLAVRELIVAGALGLLKRRLGFGTLQVSFVGKTATLCLLYAFPLLLLGTYAGNLGEITRIIGWAFAIWGTALYWWAAALYLVQARDLLTGRLTVPAEQRPHDRAPHTPEGAA